MVFWVKIESLFHTLKWPCDHSCILKQGKKFISFLFQWENCLLALSKIHFHLLPLLSFAHLRVFFAFSRYGQILCCISTVRGTVTNYQVNHMICLFFIVVGDNCISVSYSLLMYIWQAVGYPYVACPFKWSRFSFMKWNVLGLIW